MKIAILQLDTARTTTTTKKRKTTKKFKNCLQPQMVKGVGGSVFENLEKGEKDVKKSDE